MLRCRGILVAAIVCLVALPGCIVSETSDASQKVSLATAVTALGFVPGTTTRQQVKTKLGEPARAFEGEGVLVYHVERGEDGVARGWPPVFEKEGRTDLYNSKGHYPYLVLAFDERGVLSRQSFIPNEN